MTDIPPGVSPTGSNLGSAGATASRTIGQRVGSWLMGGTSFNVDTKSLDQLHQKLKTVANDVADISRSISQLNTKLNTNQQLWDKMATSAQKFVKASSTAASGTGLTTGTFSATTGSGAPKETQSGAPTSALTPQEERSLAYGVVGEVGSKWAGSLNSAMAGVTSSGAGLDVLARQASLIYGTSVGNQIRTYNRVLRTSTSDLTTAVSSLMSNRLLAPDFFKRGQSQNNVVGLLNTFERANPTLGATGSASLVNSLTSGPALQVVNKFDPNAAKTGVVINPMTGQANSPSTVMHALINTLFGRNVSDQQMKAISSNPRTWATLSQNIKSGWMSGLDLNDADLTLLQEFAASGGNLKKVTNTMAAAPAETALTKTSAKSSFQVNAFEGSVSAQNAINKFDADLYTAGSNVLSFSRGALANAGVGLASLASSALSLVSTFYEIRAVSSGLKTIISRIGGNVTPSAASDAESVGAGAAAGAGAEAATAAEVAGGVSGSVATGGLLALPIVGTLLAKKLSNFMETHHVFGEVTSSQFDALRALKQEYPHASQKQLAAMAKAIIGNPDPSFISPGSLAASGNESIRGSNPFDGGDPLPGMGDPTGSTTTSGMSAGLAAKITAMRAMNPQIKITSGHRNSAQQAFLYAMKGGRGVARPGRSRHQRGLAADLGPPSQFGWIARNAARYGLNRPAPRSEPWHVEHMGDSLEDELASALSTPATTGENVGLNNTFISTVGENWLSSLVQPSQGGQTVGSLFQNKSVYDSPLFVLLARLLGGKGGGSGVMSSSSSSSSSGGSGGNGSVSSASSGGGSAPNLTSKQINSLVKGGVNSPSAFSADLLKGLHVKPSGQDIYDLNAWQQAEGQWSASGIFNAREMHNPLNTTSQAYDPRLIVAPGGGSTWAYGLGLKNQKQAWAEGVGATLGTIEGGLSSYHYSNIVSALQHNASLSSFTKAIESTPWAGGHYGYEASFADPSGVYSGDPTTGMMGASVSGMGGHGACNHYSYTLHMPIQVVGNQQDAERLGKLVEHKIQGMEEKTTIGSR